VTTGGGAPPGQEKTAGRSVDERVGRATVAGRTHVGLQRPLNEDAVVVASTTDRGGPRSMAVVCDGIAAGAGGDRAALAAANAALAILQAATGGRAETALRQAVAAAHRAVCEIGIEAADGQDEPGTTLVAAIARGTSVDVAWVGDSRAYLVPLEGPAELLTRDHSWVTKVVEDGDLTEAEARASKWAQVITRCIGPAEDPDPARPPEPSLRSLVAPPASVLVMCSDGLWGMFDSAHALAAAVRSAPDGGDADVVAEWLVDRALAAGAADDVTVAVICI